ncbi:MAG: acetyl-CoA acetyltransferase [Lentisphaerae bacterium GWF2_45_14]|nr:MAG: acetyl-CoA acetyltransferase [Lentisphaerae bacterium GWF2_45_14]
MRDVLLTGAVRTPIGDLNGAFAGVSVIELGKASGKASLERSKIAESEIEEVIIGNVLQAGLGQNPARQIAIGCGIPVHVPSFTVNQVCGSGLKAIDLAYQRVASGAIKAALAGGMESMSGAPHILPALRGGVKLGEAALLDTVINDGLTDVFGNYHMGMTAENIAEKYAISREEQDSFSVQSQKKYAMAARDGLFSNEIVPITVKTRKKESVIDSDEHPRPATTMEDLAKLRPAFKKDGTVTAGNASGINDGAASVIVVDSSNVAECSLCVKIRDIVCVGCDPAFMGLGPVPAVKELLKRQRMRVGNIDLWELNEAFAAQSIAVTNELDVDIAKVNVNGGAIALGHPIGASGARIVVTLFHEMKRRNSSLGIASLCVGGGMGIAILLENI